MDIIKNMCKFENIDKYTKNQLRLELQGLYFENLRLQNKCNSQAACISSYRLSTDFLEKISTDGCNFQLENNSLLSSRKQFDGSTL